MRPRPLPRRHEAWRRSVRRATQPRGTEAPGADVPASHSASAQAAAAAQLAAERLSDPARAGAALTSDTQMVALGSRRGFDGARGWNGNQGGFPPVESERGHRNGDSSPSPRRRPGA